MRNLLILLLVLVNMNTHSQTVLDYFLMVPDSVNILDNSGRKKMVDFYNKRLEHPNELYRFDTVDIKNGYLSIGGAFNGSWEMCYWNKSNGNKIIGISLISCGPVCWSENSFYEYSKGKIIALKTDSILPKIDNEDFYDISMIKSNNSRDDFIKIQKEFRFGETYHLPQQGLNITVYFEQIDDIDKEKYKIYYKKNYNQMTLIWNDGHFIKGN